MDGGYQLIKNVGLTKRNCHLKSSVMARYTFKICRAS